MGVRLLRTAYTLAYTLCQTVGTFNSAPLDFRGSHGRTRTSVASEWAIGLAVGVLRGSDCRRSIKRCHDVLLRGQIIWLVGKAQHVRSRQTGFT